MKIFGFLHNSIIGLSNESKTINLQIFYKQMTACPSFYLINWNQLDGLPFQSMRELFHKSTTDLKWGLNDNSPCFPLRRVCFVLRVEITQIS